MKIVCKKCAHEWHVEFDLPMPVDEFVAKLGDIRCPQCGAGQDDLALKT